MNEILRSLYERKSVRAFTDEAISPEEKAAILRAAAEAPTAGNQQLYTILDLTDEDMKKALVPLCDNQPFIASAPMVLIFLADCRKWYRAFSFEGLAARAPGPGDLMLAASDANIAAQNAVCAAESLGIGSCYIGDIMENKEALSELLSLPAWVFPAAMLVFGRPTEQQLGRKKPRRCAMEHIVHENGYRDMDEAELRNMLGYKAGQKSYEAWLKGFCDFKFNSDFSREMTRSVREYWKDFE
ncbi:MAG: nitroreductase family protein [Oscillospiraceae bacterium]|nr:nitroreductase family protein [Oscillospiraceae bacterium]